MEIEFLEQAYLEYQEAIDYYELQFEGLSKKFIDEITRVLEIAKKYPKSFSNYSGHTKKAVLNKFPFNVIYAVIRNKIYVIAIAHQHRKPSYWAERIR